jgi:pyridinium-3,5-bisthiocarboxylic acid mononucleotide nickel chelatase
LSYDSVVTQTIAYLDCSHGISEMLLLGALLDLGFPLALLEQALAPMQLLEGYQLQHTTCVEYGVRGSRFSDGHTVSQIVDLTLTDIQGLLASSALAPHIQQRVLEVCNCLVDAKKRYGGETDVEADHDAVGCAGAIIALIGIMLGLDFFGVTQMYSSPLPLTHGTIQTDEGLLSTVMPITLELLRKVGATWRPSLWGGELVTPLGAAILATLARFESPVLRIEHMGYGFGQRELSQPCSGGLRVYLGQSSVEQEASCVPSVAMALTQGAETDWVMVIESHIDNMSGELLGGFMERLFAVGALDVSYTPIQMKKNRPATLLTILCLPEIGEQLALLVLQETTTLGVRMQQVRRLKAQRHQETILTSLGPIIVKVKQLGSRIISATPEYEECQRIALKQNIPLQDVYEVARVAIQNTIIDSTKAH